MINLSGMRWFFCLLFILPTTLQAASDWQTPLSHMALTTNVTELNRSNCVPLLLSSFQSNDVVKALIFMPGATDEFYLFRRGRTRLTNAQPTLLDAVTALTNQTLIRATFRPPLLLLHTDEDPVEPLLEIRDLKTANRLEARTFLPHVVFNDNDWDFLYPILKKQLRVGLTPGMHTRHSWHFYRHSLAAWNLNGWEALEAVSLAGKTRYTIESGRIDFEGDVRVMANPNTDHYLRDN